MSFKSFNTINPMFGHDFKKYTIARHRTAASWYIDFHLKILDDIFYNLETLKLYLNKLSCFVICEQFNLFNFLKKIVYVLPHENIRRHKVNVRYDFVSFRASGIFRFEQFNWEQHEGRSPYNIITSVQQLIFSCHLHVSITRGQAII